MLNEAAAQRRFRRRPEDGAVVPHPGRGWLLSPDSDKNPFSFPEFVPRVRVTDEGGRSLSPHVTE